MTSALDNADDAWRRPPSRVATFGLALALLAALVEAGVGPAYRFEALPLGTAFTLLRWAAWGGLAAAALSLIGVYLTRPGGRRRGMLRALVGLVVGVAVAAVPYAQLRQAKSLPQIHDISTDTEDPPPFVEVLALRADAPNSAEYGGPEVARQQHDAYPDVLPAVLDVAPEQAFARSLAAARKLGWTVVAARPRELRIEAMDRTFWFGFRDDIVIRIRPNDGGSRVDVRSVSRVGRSDVGANARRIRRFLDVL